MYLIISFVILLLGLACNIFMIKLVGLLSKKAYVYLAVFYTLAATSIAYVFNCKNIEGGELIFSSLFANMLIVVAIIDLLSYYVYTFMLLFYGVILVTSKIFLTGGFSLQSAFIGFAFSFGVYLAIYLISKWIYKREAFGFGDVLLISLIGFLEGKDFIYLYIFLPFYIAPIFLVFALILSLIFRSEKLKMSSEIPFGPYIALGAWILHMHYDVVANVLSYLNKVTNIF